MFPVALFECRNLCFPLQCHMIVQKVRSPYHWLVSDGLKKEASSGEKGSGKIPGFSISKKALSFSTFLLHFGNLVPHDTVDAQHFENLASILALNWVLTSLKSDPLGLAHILASPNWGNNYVVSRANTCWAVPPNSTSLMQ